MAGPGIALALRTLEEEQFRSPGRTAEYHRNGRRKRAGFGIEQPAPPVPQLFNQVLRLHQCTAAPLNRQVLTCARTPYRIAIAPYQVRANTTWLRG